MKLFLSMLVITECIFLIPLGVLAYLFLPLTFIELEHQPIIFISLACWTFLGFTLFLARIVDDLKDDFLGGKKLSFKAHFFRVAITSVWIFCCSGLLEIVSIIKVAELWWTIVLFVTMLISLLGTFGIWIKLRHKSLDIQI